MRELASPAEIMSWWDDVHVNYHRKVSRLDVTDREARTSVGSLALFLVNSQLGAQHAWDLPTCYNHLVGQYGSCLVEGQSVQGGLSGQQKAELSPVAPPDIVGKAGPYSGNILPTMKTEV